MMDSIPSTPNGSFTQFWKHDRDDIQLDNDLLSLMECKTHQLETKVLARSRSTEKAPAFNPNQQHLPMTSANLEHEPRSLVEEGQHPKVQKPLRVLRVIHKSSSQKGLYNSEEAQNYVHVSQYYRKPSPEPEQVPGHNASPVGYSSNPEGQKKLRITKKPSFNGGTIFQSSEESPEKQGAEDLPQYLKEHVKLSHLLNGRRSLKPQKSLPFIGSPQLNIQAINPLFLPLYKIIEQEPKRDKGDRNTKSRNGSALKRRNENVGHVRRDSNPLKRDVRTPAKKPDYFQRSLDDPSPNGSMILIRKDVPRIADSQIKILEASSSQLKEDFTGSTLASFQPPHHPYNGGASEATNGLLKSLVKLPRIKRGMSNDITPLALPPGILEKSPTDAAAGKEHSNFTAAERKLSRFSKPAIAENFMFRMAAAQQLKQFISPN